VPLTIMNGIMDLICKLNQYTEKQHSTIILFISSFVH